MSGEYGVWFITCPDMDTIAYGKGEDWAIYRNARDDWQDGECAYLLHTYDIAEHAEACAIREHGVYIGARLATLDDLIYEVLVRQ